ncbi:TonB-dependent receptor [Sphingomonas sp. ID0503]|uniref:TonB-dependent receptor n=1 Tax=Sphingomonas sp. ID0503 TaxID=3399691 RepID=UPI003AFB48E4
MVSRRGAPRAILLSGIALMAAIPSLAIAADAPEAAIEDGDIIVTATRREELAKDVPVAVTVLAGEKLDVINSSGLDIRVLSARTPSLLIESSFGRTFPRFYIRGLGNTDFDPNAAQPVSVVYDDVALESPMLKSFPVFDLANVQVLRGPQGTLFGRNTPAGVVKIDSAKPSDSFGGYGSVSWGTYNTVNAEAAVGGPIGEGLSFRISGLLQRRDDWVENDATAGNADDEFEGYRDLAGRFQLAYTSGDFNALWNIHGRDLNGTPRIFRAGAIAQGSNHFAPGFDKDHVAVDGFTSQDLKQWGTNLHLDYTFDGVGTLYSITAYERAKVDSTGDIDGGNIYAFPPLGLNVALFPSNTGGITKPREFSQELRFATEDMGGLQFQGGGYYFRQKLFYNELSYTTAGAIDGNVVHRNINENYGIFASGTYTVDALTLRAGVRYSHDKRRDFVGGMGIAPGVTLPVTTRASDDNVSWDASATYALNDQVNVYARFATGYLGPAIQDRVNFGGVPTVASKQTTISGEAGFKGASADRTLSFSVNGYWWRTKDLQLTAVGGAVNTARLINAEKAIGYGAELDVMFKPVDGLELTAGGSYNFTEIRDNNLAVAPCGSGQCTVTDPLNAAGLAILDGNDLPQAPRWIANATARYAIPVGSGEVFAYTDWAYRSRINYFLYTAKEFRGRASLEGGLKVGYKTADDLEIAAFARNITNQIRIVSAIDFNNLTGMINEPRILGVSVRKGF